MSETDVMHLINVYDLDEWRAASLQGRLDLVRRLLVEVNDDLRVQGREAPYARVMACADLTLDEAIGHLRSERKFFRDLLTVAPEPDAGVEAAAVPDLDHAEARAVVKGACRAVSASPLAEPVQPMGSDLRRLAAAIDGMHAEIEGGGDA